MKKIILSLLLLLTVNLMSFSQKDSNSANERSSRRSIRTKSSIIKYSEAIKEQNFTFFAQHLLSPYGSLMGAMDSQENYVALYPSSLDVVINYLSTNWSGIPTTRKLDFSDNKYTYKYSIDETQTVINIEAKNVYYKDVASVPQYYDYTLSFKVSLATGFSQLTINSEDDAPIVIHGYIQYNN